MPVDDHQIRNLDSFNKVTDDPYHIAGLYFYYQLDCLVDLAHKVSHDFYDRPELFIDLVDVPGPPPVKFAKTLAELHARYGTDEKFLNNKQRHAIYSALFGKSAAMDGMGNEEGNFPNLRDELIEACGTFVETKFGDKDSLRVNVLQKHRLFKEYLTGLKGSSVAWSREDALADLTEKISYQILRNQGVSAVYGIRKAPTDKWPYDFDSNADKLVEEISKQLMSPEKSEETDADGKHEMRKYISRVEITNLQRAAIEGAKAIATVIDVDDNTAAKDVEEKLIRKCYTWSTALRNLKNYPRAFSKTFVSRAAEKPRGGIAVAQPLTGATMQPMKS